MAQDSECLFVGIDSHQDSLSIAVLPLGASHPAPVQKIPNDPARIRRVFRKLLERGSVHATYEAGCTGFVLWRQLTELGVDCVVAAPSRDDRQLLEYKLRRLATRESELAELDERIEQRALRGDIEEKVRALKAFRGVQTLIATNVVAELGDPRRFPNHAAVAAYVGLVPSERSSGNQVRRGGITRAGSMHLRRLLVEASQHYRRLYPEAKSLRLRREQAPAQVRDLARSIERRLVKKYRRLSIAKHTNLAKAAVARELVGHLWEALRMAS